MTSSIYRFSALVTLILISTFSYWDYSVTALLMILLTAWVCKDVVKKGLFNHFSMSNIMLFYLFWLYMVSLNSTVHTVSNTSIVLLIGLPMMYLLATNFAVFMQSWKILIGVLLGVGVAVSLLAIWQVHNKIGAGYAQGPFNDRNAFAALLNLLWFPAVFLFFKIADHTPLWPKVLLGSCLYVISLAFFATSSRGGILTWVLLMPILLWAGYKNFKTSKVVIIVLITVFFAYLSSSLFLNSTIVDRNFSVAQDASIFARLYIWKSTLLMALDYPILGTGWGTFGYFYPAYRLPTEKTTAGFFAHNDYLQFAAEGGMLASLILVTIFGYLLLKLRVLLKVSSQTSFESVALLLGVLALFIHALVNFIFYFAFMSAVAGLFLARIAMLSETPNLLKLPHLGNVRDSVKKLVGSLVVIYFALPYLVHVLAQLCLTGDKLGLKGIQLIAPAVQAYDVANLITSIYPADNLAQEYMLRTYEYYLIEVKSSNKDTAVAQTLLKSAIGDMDALRARSANQAELGIRELKLVQANQASFNLLANNPNAANIKAYQILNDNLSANPYHAISLIMLARLQAGDGLYDKALNTLQLAQAKVLVKRDAQLVTIEILRQAAAPKVVEELDELEVKLNGLKTDAEKSLDDFKVNQMDIHEYVDRRLNEIANKLKLAD